MSAAPVPSELKLRRGSRCLQVRYADGRSVDLPFEYLRVFSPSAEVRGHGLEETILVPGKMNVGVSRMEAVGRYAVRLVFDDGHDTGLYSWQVLDDLVREQPRHWARYLERMDQHGLSREVNITKLSALGPKKWTPPGGS